MKTKVIAFRTTQHQFEVLQAINAKRKEKNISETISGLLFMNDEYFEESIKVARKRKRLENKAKRDAKKAAANGVQ